MRRTALGIAVVMLMATPVAAQHGYRASDQRLFQRDANDVGHRLDISTVSFIGHGDGTATLTLKTFERWGCAYINRELVSDGGTASVRWEVNTNNDVYTERVAAVECAEGKWHLVWGQRNFPATKSDGRTLAVRLNLAKLRLNRNRHLSFTAVTFANGVFGHEIVIEETDTAKALKPYSAR